MVANPNTNERPLMLQTKDHGNLLNTIDDLRSQGISSYIDLPQIVVCGDQSSGKSSVLEAVSGIRFPRKDNLCTRFATEVILRRGPYETTNVSIVPGHDRSEDEKERLAKFYRKHIKITEFGDLVEEAKSVMGLMGDSRAFSNDILRVEVSGPLQPHLTLVDLPGLFQAGNKAQSDEDVVEVTELVRGYMKKRRSIILAVVSAKNDFANQIVTKYARELDPTGRRTLGVITKPDTLYAGSDSEKSFIELAENKDVVFHLGWHVIKNRDYDTRDSSDKERDDAERKFFAEGAWAKLSRRQVGITTLKSRLSTLLRDQILFEVPSLIQDVEKGIQECNTVLERLGVSRATLQEQRLYLLEISQTFTELIKASIDGNYTDAFFESAATEIGYCKRLRAVVQNQLLKFAQAMRQKGHANQIVENITEPESSDLRLITRGDFIIEVQSLMQRSRGCELPGTYSPHIIKDLFHNQAQPWQALVETYTNRIWKSVMDVLELILEHTADSITAAELRQYISPRMESIKSSLDRMVSNVLTQHQRGHPITYNHYLIDNIQKLRQEHQRKHLTQKLNAFFNTDINNGDIYCEKRSYDISNLLNTLALANINDMDQYACSEAIDVMKAYYKVALKTLVDDFSILAIERCLLQELPTLLSPQIAANLDDATVSKIAAETAESRDERHQTSEKLQALQKALGVLKKLQHVHSMNSTTKPESTNVGRARKELEVQDESASEEEFNDRSSGTASDGRRSRSPTPGGDRGDGSEEEAPRRLSPSPYRHKSTKRSRKFRAVRE